MRVKLNRQQIYILFLLAFSCGLIFLTVHSWRKNFQMAPLEISYLDVGQGDAILINYLHRYQILIDGGPSEKKVLTELGRVMPNFDNKIEVVIITHPDRDHFTGLLGVLRKYKIGAVLHNGQRSVDPLWRELTTMVQKRQIIWQTIGEGSTLEIGKSFVSEVFKKKKISEQPIKIKIFNPDKISTSQKIKNSSSVVARLDYGENSFLFTGDIDFDGESDMIFDQEDIDVDWLKVSHHGSKYSSSDFFLARVSPQTAIISVGKNDYGHPSTETLNRLKKIGAKILRTDQLGTIKIICRDEKCYEVQ